MWVFKSATSLLVVSHNNISTGPPDVHETELHLQTKREFLTVKCQTLILSLSRRVCRRLSSGGESMIFQKNTLWFVSSDVIIHGELRKSDLLRFGAFAAVAQSSVTATFGEERMTPRRSRRRRGLSRRMRRRVGAETLHEDDVPNHCLRLGIISLRMMGITHLSDGGEGIGDYVPSWW